MSPVSSSHLALEAYPNNISALTDRSYSSRTSPAWVEIILHTPSFPPYRTTGIRIIYPGCNTPARVGG